MESKLSFYELENFYNNKRVFLTGHTGFKGSWLALWLLMMGAKVSGFALEAEDESLFNILGIKHDLDGSIIGDIRDEQKVTKAIKDFQPEIIIHMAAQSLVRPSYIDPKLTYETNVIGTLNIFEAARKSGSVKTILNITTDKCYENRESHDPYKEEDHLGGYDPYSSSKACAEILTSSYRRSFFEKENIAVATARAGNVIGGGDFSRDRIIPDIFRSIRDEKIVSIRSPKAIRPWQHVLEPLNGYLILTKNLYQNPKSFSKSYNFGPNSDAEVTVENLAKIFITEIGKGSYEINANADLHEAGILKLDNNKAKIELDWQPKLSFEETIFWTASWYKNYLVKTNIKEFTKKQIEQFSQ